MKVLVLGGTGSIGEPAVRSLLARGHRVVGLARSERSVRRLEDCGAEALRGNLRAPRPWLAELDDVDGVIQVAGEFRSDDDVIEGRLLDAVLPRLQDNGRWPALILTGGCWLYGNTGDAVATESSSFDPAVAHAWTAHMDRVLAAPRVRGLVIHPAMVYERDGGVFAQFREDIASTGRVRVIGSEAVRWPLVHREDIGELYALALERGAGGASYNGAAVEGIRVGVFARAMARRAGVEETPLVLAADDAAREFGEWARGHAIDQQMSGERARSELGWRPVHFDPVAEVS